MVLVPSEAYGASGNLNTPVRADDVASMPGAKG